MRSYKNNFKSLFYSENGILLLIDHNWLLFCVEWWTFNHLTFQHDHSFHLSIKTQQVSVYLVLSLRSG